MTYTDRYADLWLSNFAADPYEVATTLRTQPIVVAREGDPHGIRRLPTRKNLIVIRHSFGGAEPWSDAINALISSLGGWDEFERLLMRLSNADCMIQLTLPIRNSPNQENNFVDSATISRLGQYRIDLGFEFQ